MTRVIIRIACRFALALGACALFAAPARAWNDTGHMTVAYIAYKQLTPRARQAVDHLLTLNPDVEAFGKNLPAAWPEEARRLAKFMFAATWPDVIKSKPGFVSDGPKGGNEPAPVPESAQNIGYADKLMHKYWHYIDVPFSTDGTPLVQPPVPNAQTQLAIMRAALANPQLSDDIRSYDLVWIAHIIGDLHQPLHTVSRISKARPQGDDGGNTVSMCDAPCRANLHGFWDNALGSGNVDVAVSVGQQLMAMGRPSGADKMETAQWVAEGVAAAKKTVYASPIQPESPLPGVSVPNRKYRRKSRDLAEDRVRLAGYRLAAVINAALK